MIETGKVGMVATSSIVVLERIRQEMGDLDALESNMLESGLISPLAVMDNKDGTFSLLAGERRFRVLSRNSVENIPVRIYEQELSDLEMTIIEEAENLYRKDMTFWEQDKLTAKIHRMKQELLGAKPSGPGTDGWGTRDTAALIGAKSSADVTMAVKRADAREAFPELFDGCKTASDASKVLKKVDEALIKRIIAQKLEDQKSEGVVNQMSKCFIVRDFFEGVKGVPDGIIHLVEIDPPYAIDVAKQKKIDGESPYILENYNEIRSEDYQVFLSKLFRECYRVMANHSWLVCWFAPEPWFDVVYKEICKAGFETTRMVGTWSKGIPGQNKRPEIHLANSYEMFFYAWKGQPALNKAGRSNEFRFSPIPYQQKTHPTERPIELMKELYETFAFVGSRILIPFLGSGNGIIAASQLGMTATGFELSKAYKDSFLVKVHLMNQSI